MENTGYGTHYSLYSTTVYVYSLMRTAFKFLRTQRKKYILYSVYLTPIIKLNGNYTAYFIIRKYRDNSAFLDLRGLQGDKYKD